MLSLAHVIVQILPMVHLSQGLRHLLNDCLGFFVRGGDTLRISRRDSPCSVGSRRPSTA